MGESPENYRNEQRSKHAGGDIQAFLPVFHGCFLPAETNSRPEADSGATPQRSFTDGTGSAI